VDETKGKRFPNHWATSRPVELIGTYGLEPNALFSNAAKCRSATTAIFSHAAVIRRINSELANDLGNLAQRVLSMINKNCDAKVPQPGTFSEADRWLLDKATELLAQVRQEMDVQALHKVLDKLWVVIGDGNRFVDEQAPWALKKTDPARMADSSLCAGRSFAPSRHLLQPFMRMLMGKLLISLPFLQRTRLRRA